VEEICWHLNIFEETALALFSKKCLDVFAGLLFYYQGFIHNLALACYTAISLVRVSKGYYLQKMPQNLTIYCI